MSSMSAAATKSTSDKVDVSFESDDEEEESSSAATEESEAETTSSSASDGEEKSDEDGDADDESDMPTFTLSLQPSTGTEDQDDALPDLSRPSTLQQETTSHIKMVTVRTQSTNLTTKTDATMSDITNEKQPLSSEKNEEKIVAVVEENEEEEMEEEKEEEDGDDESEESEATSEEEKEEKTEDDDQTTSLSFTAAASTAKSVSGEEQLSSSVSKVLVAETKICMREVNEEQASPVSVKSKQMRNAEKSSEKNEQNVSEVHDKQSSAVKKEEKHSKSFVVDVSKTEIETEEKVQDLSRTAAAETIEVETTQTSQTISRSVENQGIKSTKKKKKDSEAKELTSQSWKADTIEPNPVQKISKLLDTMDVKTTEHSEIRETPKSTSKSHKTRIDARELTEDFSGVAEEKSVSVTEKATKTAHKSKAKEAKLESGKAAGTVGVTSCNTEAKDEQSVTETRLSTVKLSDSDVGTTRKSPAHELTEAKSSKVNEVGEIKEQKENTETKKNSKARKSKAEAKESKNEVESTVQDELPASVNVTTKTSTGEVESNKTHTTKTADKNPTHKTEIEKDDSSSNKRDKTVTAETVAKVSETDKGKDTIKDARENRIEMTSTNTVEVTASEPSETADKASVSETFDGKPTSKKKVKDLTVDSQKKIKAATEGPAPSTLSDKESPKILKTDIQIKQEEAIYSETEVRTDSSLAPVTEPQNDLTEHGPDKKKHLLAKTGTDETKLNDARLNGVDDDNEKPQDEAEFRPRRNSIDEFIKRILAEARDEQKKILDSCAVSSDNSAEPGTSVSASVDVASTDVPLSRGSASEAKHQQPIVNGVDVSLPASTVVRKNREDIDIDDELADISRYYSKRTLVDRPAVDNDVEEAVEDSTRPVKSNFFPNGEDGAATNDEPLHFVPLRRDATSLVVRESARPVKILVDQQTTVIRQLSETSRAVDELDNEIRQLRQSCGGREVLCNTIGAAIREELRLYEMELEAAGGRLDQQRLPGGGRFVREQFVSQCAAELFHRPITLNGPRLDRSAAVDDWTRVSRRRSGSFSATSVDDDIGSTRSSSRAWIHDREPTDLTVLYRHSRAGSVASDRGYSSLDPADEPRAATSSVLSRLTAINGSIAAVEFDLVGRSSRASSEAPRTSYSRPQTTYTDEWVSSGGSAYSAGRQYSVCGHEDTNGGDLDIGYRFASTRQPTYRIHHAPSVDTTSAQPSRLYARRGSLQGYSSYDSGSVGDASHSFNSRFLSRVREKKALGETTTTSRQSSSDRPFRSRFLKSSSVVGGGTSTAYSSGTSRSKAQYDDYDDN